eukprot:1142245-Pelagomonas_calceolata.AAC.1
MFENIKKIDIANVTAQLNGTAGGENSPLARVRHSSRVPALRSSTQSDARMASGDGSKPDVLHAMSPPNQAWRESDLANKTSNLRGIRQRLQTQQGLLQVRPTSLRHPRYAGCNAPIHIEVRIQCKNSTWEQFCKLSRIP